MMNLKSSDVVYTWRLTLSDGRIIHQYSSNGIEMSFKSISPGEMKSIVFVSKDKTLPDFMFDLTSRNPIYFKRVTRTLFVGSADMKEEINSIKYGLGYEDEYGRIVYIVDPQTKEIILEQ